MQYLSVLHLLEQLDIFPLLLGIYICLCVEIEWSPISGTLPCGASLNIHSSRGFFIWFPFVEVQM